MAIEVLRPLQVHKAGAGYHSDGGGLFLFVRAPSELGSFVTPHPAASSVTWGLLAAERLTIAIAANSLAQARKAAQHARDLMMRGVDPIDERKDAKGKGENRSKRRRGGWQGSADNTGSIQSHLSRARDRTEPHVQARCSMDCEPREQLTGLHLAQADR